MDATAEEKPGALLLGVLASLAPPGFPDFPNHLGSHPTGNGLDQRRGMNHVVSDMLADRKSVV